MEPDQLAAQAFCRTRISEYRNKIISASLDDLKSKTESIPNLLALLLSPYLTSLNDRLWAFAEETDCVYWALNSPFELTRELSMQRMSRD